MKLIVLAILLSGCASSSGAYAWPSQVVVGNTYDIAIPTHCGLVSFWMDDDWWHFTSSPNIDGWGNPRDRGVVQLVDESHGIYRSSRGDYVPVERGGNEPPPCV